MKQKLTEYSKAEDSEWQQWSEGMEQQMISHLRQTRSSSSSHKKDYREPHNAERSQNFRSELDAARRLSTVEAVEQLSPSQVSEQAEYQRSSGESSNIYFTNSEREESIAKSRADLLRLTKLLEKEFQTVQARLRIQVLSEKEVESEKQGSTQESAPKSSVPPSHAYRNPCTYKNPFEVVTFPRYLHRVGNAFITH